MTPFYIVANPIGSKFARRLQAALREMIENPVYRRRTPKVVRGQTRPYFLATPKPLNKIEQFERFNAASVSAPRYCTSKEGVRQSDWTTVFARTIINGTNGRGIIEFRRDDAEYPDAPLFTEYVPKKAEYRFHVFNGKVIDVQQKRKKQGFEHERNTRVRNLHNGYVYCRDDLNPPDGAADLAVRAVAACGYLHGAVDLIYNERRNQCYVLEVNSRPGLMGTTLVKYCEAIIKMINQ